MRMYKKICKLRLQLVETINIQKIKYPNNQILVVNRNVVSITWKSAEKQLDNKRILDDLHHYFLFPVSQLLPC